MTIRWADHHCNIADEYRKHIDACIRATRPLPKGWAELHTGVFDMHNDEIVLFCKQVKDNIIIEEGMDLNVYTQPEWMRGHAGDIEDLIPQVQPTFGMEYDCAVSCKASADNLHYAIAQMIRAVMLIEIFHWQGLHQACMHKGKL